MKNQKFQVLTTLYKASDVFSLSKEATRISLVGPKVLCHHHKILGVAK